MRDKAAHNKYNNEWARNNRDKVNVYYRSWKSKRREWYRSLKEGKSCEDCPEVDVDCLHYHHLDPKTKIDAVANLFSQRANKVLILEEIKKCILLCANCHQKRHSKRF